MSRILVSLVSDQTVPNVLMMKECGDIDAYLLITTEQMERKSKSAHIIAASGIDPAKFYRPLLVIEDSLNDIERKLASFEFDDADQFIVNLTGGTKIMSIGVYNFFRRRFSEIYYVPIGKNNTRKIFPEVKNREQKLESRLNIEEYLTSYGIEIQNRHKIHQLTKSAEETRQFYERYLLLSEEELSVLDSLRSFRSEDKITIESVVGLSALLQEVRFQPTQPECINKGELKYLSGDWLEEYCYTLIKSDLNLPDGAIGCGIYIVRGKVVNEFDVLFTRDNALFVVECKTDLFDSGTSRSILDDALYKLSALSREFGLRAHSYIFTLSRRGTAKGEIRPAQEKRATLMNIRIVDRTDLASLSTQKELLTTLF